MIGISTALPAVKMSVLSKRVRQALSLPNILDYDSSGWVDNRTTDPVWVEDHEGILREIPEGELVFKEARVVKNLLSNVAGISSEDLTSTGWAGSNATIVNANTWTTTAANGLLYINNVFGKTDLNGETYVARFKVSVDTDCQIRCMFGGFQYTSYQAITAAQGVVDFSLSLTVSATTTLNSLRIQCDTDGVTITTTEVQIENVTGQANQNPGEYVPVGTADGTELVTNGNFSAWTSDDPDGWTDVGIEDANNYVTEDSNGARLVTDGTNIGISQADVMTVGETYVVSITIDETVSGTGLTITDGTTNVETGITSSSTFIHTATDTDILVKRTVNAGEYVISSISVQKATDGFAYKTTTNALTVVDGVVADRTGTELAPGTTVLDANWTDNGDGSYTCDGLQAGNAVARFLNNDGILLDNEDYAISFNVSDVVGTLQVLCGATGDTDTNITSDFSQVMTVNGTSTNDAIRLVCGAGESCTVSNISIKQVTTALTPYLYHVPAATNLVSEPVDFSAWTGLNGGCTVTTNTAIAPDGSFNADDIELINGTGDAQRIEGIVLAASTEYTASIYVKAVDSTQSKIIIYDDNASGNLAFINFDWTDGVPSTFSSTGGLNETYTDAGNGWYRIVFNATTAATVTTHQFRLYPNSADTNTYSILAWGAQLETGSFATPIIPDSGNLTRNATDYSTPLIEESGYDEDGDGDERAINYSLWNVSDANITVDSDNKTVSFNGSQANYSLARVRQESGVNYVPEVADYVYSFTVTGRTQGGVQLYSDGYYTDNGTHTGSFTANGSSVLTFQCNDGGFDGTISNISVQRVKRNFTNFKQTEGTLVFDFVPEYDVNGANDPVGLFSIQDSATGTLELGADGVRSRDGTNVAGQPDIDSNGTDKYRCAVYWSDADSEMGVAVRNVTQSGNWSAWQTATYDGEYGVDTDINLFYSNTYLNQLHDLKVYDRALTTTEIENL